MESRGKERLLCRPRPRNRRHEGKEQRADHCLEAGGGIKLIQPRHVTAIASIFDASHDSRLPEPKGQLHCKRNEQRPRPNSRAASASASMEGPRPFQPPFPIVPHWGSRGSQGSHGLWFPLGFPADILPVSTQLGFPAKRAPLLDGLGRSSPARVTETSWQPPRHHRAPQLLPPLLIRAANASRLGHDDCQGAPLGRPMGPSVPSSWLKLRGKPVPPWSRRAHLSLYVAPCCLADGKYTLPLARLLSPMYHHRRLFSLL